MLSVAAARSPAARTSPTRWSSVSSPGFWIAAARSRGAARCRPRSRAPFPWRGGTSSWSWRTFARSPSGSTIVRQRPRSPARSRPLSVTRPEAGAGISAGRDRLRGVLWTVRVDVGEVPQGRPAGPGAAASADGSRRVCPVLGDGVGTGGRDPPMTSIPLTHRRAPRAAGRRSARTTDGAAQPRDRGRHPEHSPTPGAGRPRGWRSGRAMSLLRRAPRQVYRVFDEEEFLSDTTVDEQPAPGVVEELTRRRLGRAAPVLLLAASAGIAPGDRHRVSADAKAGASPGGRTPRRVEHRGRLRQGRRLGAARRSQVGAPRQKVGRGALAEAGRAASRPTSRQGANAAGPSPFPIRVASPGSDTCRGRSGAGSSSIRVRLRAVTGLVQGRGAHAHVRARPMWRVRLARELSRYALGALSLFGLAASARFAIAPPRPARASTVPYAPAGAGPSGRVLRGPVRAAIPDVERV